MSRADRPSGRGELFAIGLNGREEAAYELLVDSSVSTLDELMGTWSGDDLPELLAKLEAKGLVVRLAGAPDRFEAVAPEVALEGLLLTAEEYLAAVRQEGRRLAEAYHVGQIESRLSAVELVVGRRAMRQRALQVQRTAREQLRCFDRPPYLHSAESMSVELELLSRNVACRTVYDRDAVEQPGTMAGIEQLAAAGGQGRVLPHIPLKCYLADDRLALLVLQRRPTQIEAALVIHPSGLLVALESLFEGLWERALPIDFSTRAVSADSAPSRTPDQQRLMALLISGLTDKAIARQLGVSYRTIQRWIATMMSELNATTRFQAGVQAAMRARSSEGDAGLG